MLVHVAYSIPNNDYLTLDKMSQKWFRFKTLREEGVFDDAPKEGFLTVLQREKMLDDVFEILEFRGNNEEI